MNPDQLLRDFSTHPGQAALEVVRRLLRNETTRGPDADTQLMTLCCVQLFNAGSLDDVLAVWTAKQSSFDASSAIDVQMLCGAGLDETFAYLEALGSPEAHDAFAYLTSCVAAGDFEDFTPAAQSSAYDAYYGV